MIAVPGDTTAETLAVGENWPTTARSTPPYRACNSRESIKGSAKRTRGPRMGPDKNILVFFSCVSFIKGKDLLREFGHSCAQTILIIPHIAEQTKGHLRKNGGKYEKRTRRKKGPGAANWPGLRGGRLRAATLLPKCGARFAGIPGWRIWRLPGPRIRWRCCRRSQRI